ncbi:MAG: asparaginase domain-containing protein [Firmicutes bacterium]|nr:asparaginase domain-containing protein [Bacillota bacterium]
MPKRLLVVATGGTISSGVSAQGFVPQKDAEDFRRLIAVPPGWALEVKDAGHSLSSNFDLDDMVRISNEVVGANADAVIVLHGTGIMEETVFLTEMRLASLSEHKAVVFTGAQRIASEPGADGLQNLRDAVTVATHPMAWRFGASVVFEGMVLAANEVAKSDSWSLHAFTSGTAGVLARVFMNQIQIIHWPAWRFPCFGDTVEPAVDLVWFAGGMDGRRLRLKGLRGLVVAASGVGNVNATVAARIREAMDQGIVVVIATRTGAGPAFPLYGDEGGSRTLETLGVHFSCLHPLKARLLLMAGLKGPQPIADVIRGHLWGS